MTKRHRQLAAQHDSLLTKHQDLSEEAKAIGERASAEKRLQGPDEKARVETILAELDKLAPQIDAIESEMDIEAKLEAHERHGILRDVGGQPIAKQDQFRSFGEFLQGVVVAANPGYWRNRFNAGQVDELMNKMDAYNAVGSPSGASVSVGPDGGYLVRKDWSASMLDRGREESVLFSRCRNIPVGGDFDGLEYPYIDETSRATGSRWGGVQVFWKAEADTVTAKKPRIGKGELRLEEIMGLAYATERLLRDATALEGILSNAFASEFGFQIDDAIIRGNGAGQPLGFFASPAIVSVAKEGSQTAATVVAANILKMYARIPSRLKAGVVWLIHPDVMTQLPLMAIGQQPVWLPPGNLTQAPNGLLLGKPVVEIEQAEALGTQGDIFCVNLNEYVVITKAGEGLRYDTSMHVQFLTDQMAFRWVFRINGQPTWKTSLTPFKGSSALSPFVTLDTRG